MHRPLAAFAVLTLLTSTAVAQQTPAADATTPAPTAPAAEPAAAAPAADAPAAAAPAAAAGEGAAAKDGGAAADDKAAAPSVGGGMADYGVADEAVPVGSRMVWAKYRQLKVIQKRAMVKEGRHAFSLIGGVVPNDDFFAYINAGLAYNYYFSEDINLEVRGAYTVPQKTSLESSLTASRPNGPGLLVRLPQTLNAHFSVAAMWNLVHGKIGFFDTSLTEFDLGLTFGVGALMTEIQGKAKEQNLKKFDAQGNIGLTWNFYMSQRWAFRMDYRQFFYPKEGGGVSFPISATVGLTFFSAPIE